MTHQSIECPEVGVYRDVPAETYFAWRAVSASFLNAFWRSPAHAFEASLGSDEDTKEKLRGTAAHAAILTPADFEDNYAGGPCVKLNTNVGKAEWEKFKAANPGKEHIRGEEWPLIIGIRDAVWRHAAARKILDYVEETEICIVWRDAMTDVLCKARIDALAAAIGVMADLKTCRDARAHAFGRAFYDRGYYRQMQFYLLGLASAYDNADPVIIAAENTKPHAVAVYEVDPAALDLGYREICEMLPRVKECMATGIWPGYAENIGTIGLPRWAERGLTE